MLLWHLSHHCKMPAAVTKCSMFTLSSTSSAELMTFLWRERRNIARQVAGAHSATDGFQPLFLKQSLGEVADTADPLPIWGTQVCHLGYVLFHRTPAVPFAILTDFCLKAIPEDQDKTCRAVPACFGAGPVVFLGMPNVSLVSLDL